MELHFCSRCGISIPQSEVDSGSATGAGGKYFCSEHRGGVAVAEAPRPQGAGGATAGQEPELLFCANCRVSIPQDDSKSGRAHREFGSLLCAGCSKADPGERAARREAVEAEMAADVDAQDPVVARRCSVCSAVVPYGQIVTGKAKIEGNRVVCERCRAVSVARPESVEGGGFSAGPVFVTVVILGALAVGFFGMKAVTASSNSKNPAKDPIEETNALRRQVNGNLEQVQTRLKALEDRPSGPDEKVAGDLQRLENSIAKLTQSVSDLRESASKSDTDTKERIVRLETQVQSLTDSVHVLMGRSNGPAAPPTPPVEKPDPPKTAPPAGPGTTPPAPVPPAIDPNVAKLCKELAESPDVGTRFNAANELTNLKDPASIPSLVKALQQDQHLFVRRACARALGVMRAWLAVPSLIKALEDREVYVALAANTALIAVTNNDWGVTQDTPAGQRKTKAQAADKWWEKNKDHPPEGVNLHPITD